MKSTYVLCQGFGFSRNYWRNLIPMLEGKVVFYDDCADLELDGCIGIGHSLGFAKLHSSKIKFDYLVGLQGFLNFCGSDPIEKNIRKKISIE